MDEASVFFMDPYNAFCSKMNLSQPPLAVRLSFLGQAEDVVGRGVIKFGQRDQTAERQLSLAVLILRIGVLLHMQIGGNVTLGKVAILA